jgi:amidohydrolase
MDLKSAAQAAFDRAEVDLIALSHRIHAHPELSWQEQQASAWLGEALTGYGFSVTAGICELPTAFEARAGSGPLQVVICAEYDALPDIGHACGHNVIAATALGAGLALAAVTDELGLTVRVMGTPAEEVGGGKIVLLQRGAFAGAHLAMMTHPGPVDVVEWPIIAAQQFRIRYTGKAAHASAYPELGINAADALTIVGVAIGLLRQHIHPSDRIHGITTHGGEAPNIVPAHTKAKYVIRAATVADLKLLRERLMRCFQAGALATGASLDVRPGQGYAQMHHDPDLAAAYQRNATSLGRAFKSFDPCGAISTDMGNVSLVTLDPPRDQHRFTAGRQPPARIHRPLHHPRRRSGHTGWRHRPGLDSHRLRHRPSRAHPTTQQTLTSRHAQSLAAAQQEPFYGTCRVSRRRINRIEEVACHTAFNQKKESPPSEGSSLFDASRGRSPPQCISALPSHLLPPVVIQRVSRIAARRMRSSLSRRRVWKSPLAGDQKRRILITIVVLLQMGVDERDGD